MKGIIEEFTSNSITFLEDGVEEKQVLDLAEWVKPEFFKTGRAEVTVKDNLVSFISMEEQQKGTDKTDKKTKKDPYIVNIGGKDFMTYEGLLAKAHEKGTFDMTIIDSWVSEDMKMAWCKVRVIAQGQTFDGFGSSTPENTGTMTQSHPVEMAHTRAKGRALRDYLNIGKTMLEELKDGK